MLVKSYSVRPWKAFPA